MPNPTRRARCGPAGHARADDARLLEAEREIERLVALPSIKGDIPTERCSAWADQRRLIAATPAAGLVGAAVKLRALIHPDLGIGETDPDDVALARGALAVIEREIAHRPADRPKSTTGDAELIALAAKRDDLLLQAHRLHLAYRKIADTMPAKFAIGPGTPYPFPAAYPPEVRQRYEAWRRESGIIELEADDRDEKLLDEADAIRRQMLKTPAATLHGALAELRIAAIDISMDFMLPRPTVANAYRRMGRSLDGWALVSAWADVERLAGGRA